MVILGLVLLGCNRDGDTSTTPGAIGQQWSSIEGTVEYKVEVDGVALCDATIAFTGVPYTGFCPTCEFAFQVDASVERDDGTKACFYTSLLSLYENSAMLTLPTVVAFASTYDYFGSAIEDVVLIGFTYVYDDGSVSGPYAEYVGVFYDGSYYGGHAALQGDALSWGLALGAGTDHKADLEGWRYGYYPNFCSFDYVSEATAPYDPGHTTYGSLPCTYEAIDTFAFEGAADGTAEITLDVTGGNVSLDPIMWVYGPDGCVERVADDNFPCTFGDNRCPAMSLATEAGDYLLVVKNDRCNEHDGTPAEYRLDVASSWDPATTPLLDDASNVGPGTIRVEATAKLRK